MLMVWRIQHYHWNHLRLEVIDVSQRASEVIAHLFLRCLRSAMIGWERYHQRLGRVIKNTETIMGRRSNRNIENCSNSRSKRVIAITNNTPISKLLEILEVVILIISLGCMREVEQEDLLNSRALLHKIRLRIGIRNMQHYQS